MSITATVENGTITLPPGLDVPDGTTVEITLPERPAPAAQPGATLAWMLAFAGTVEGPADLAAEHDHYLHGTPRRGGAGREEPDNGLGGEAGRR